MAGENTAIKFIGSGGIARHSPELLAEFCTKMGFEFWKKEDELEVFFKRSDEMFKTKGAASRNLIKKTFKRWYRTKTLKIRDKENREKKRKAKHDGDSAPKRRKGSGLMGGKSLRAHVGNLLKVKKAPTVVIDFNFSDKLEPKEAHGITTQLQFLYSANMHCQKPVNIVFSSLKEKTAVMEGLKRATQNYLDSWVIERTHIHFLQLYYKRPKDLIYLTADCEEDLEELKENEIYVIGGILDHNRMKGVTAGFAKETGIKMRRLPIEKYMRITQQSSVLTIDQVFNALLAWWNWGCWRKALQYSIPERKGFKLKEPLSAEELANTKFEPHSYKKLKLNSVDSAKKQSVHGEERKGLVSQESKS